MCGAQRKRPFVYFVICFESDDSLSDEQTDARHTLVCTAVGRLGSFGLKGEAMSLRHGLNDQ